MSEPALNPVDVAAAPGTLRRWASSKTWQRFRRHRLAMSGVVVLAILVAMAVFAPLLTTRTPFEIDLRARQVPPSLEYWLGTDRTGRDVWTRLLYGGRVSLTVGIVAVSISALIGIFIGSISGYFRGSVDMVLMRFTDMVMMFPSLVIIISLVAIMGPSIYNAMFAIGVLGWPGIARLVRGQFLVLRETEFTVAAQAIGAPPSRVVLRHLLPNTVGTIAVAVTFAVGHAILLEAALSFLGLGVQAPTPSWGGMLRDAQTLSTLETQPWMWVPPGMMIILAVLSINFIGDGLRDALDPRLRL